MKRLGSKTCNTVGTGCPFSVQLVGEPIVFDAITFSKPCFFFFFFVVNATIGFIRVLRRGFVANDVFAVL